MKKNIFFLSLFIFLCFSHSTLLAQNSLYNNNLQLVESVPVETSLGIKQTGRTLPVWLSMINNAKKSIDLETFYVSNKAGKPLEKVIKAVLNAAARGVKVRIISDGKFYKLYPKTLNELNKADNITVRILPYFDKIDGVLHAKYFIVDDNETFIGSQDWDWRSLNQIQELGVRIHNVRFARYMLRIFDLDWKLSKLKSINKPLKLKPVQEKDIINEAHPIELSYNKKPVFLYPTFSPIGYIFPGMISDEAAILKLINGAHKRILIQLLTFNPDGYDGVFYPTLDDALIRAALRGVKVKLLVSNWNLRKPGVNFLKSLQVIPNIQVKYSVIPQYSGGFISFARVEHCKYLVADNNLLWLGSSNWAKSYFYNSRNVGVVIRGETVNSTVAKIFFNSWDSSYAKFINPCKNYKSPKIYIKKDSF